MGLVIFRRNFGDFLALVGIAVPATCGILVRLQYLGQAPTLGFSMERPKTMLITLLGAKIAEPAPTQFTATLALRRRDSPNLWLS